MGRKDGESNGRRWLSHPGRGTPQPAKAGRTWPAVFLHPDTCRLLDIIEPFLECGSQGKNDLKAWSLQRGLGL